MGCRREEDRLNGIHQRDGAEIFLVSMREDCRNQLSNNVGDNRKRRNRIIGCASSELSPAAEVIANNVDLLLCFPAKSLTQFKAVSKQWLSLISDSQFDTNHSRQNPRPIDLSLGDCNCCHQHSE
ncbi:hypothetical protein Vadar_021090 [Vaccinium darrowii]|uniref:Uncharacterized protein n=1 Tax=Vaccinium darrowii TaxID=229202 RepID=A0ACB7Z5C0_9ERIC|nr:hypothetical protein Vadar_021090 [Vaccinium darrowii]